MYKRVLVLGGTGFIGKNLQEIKPEWVYHGSKDCDLTDYQDTYAYIKKVKPDAIINLAGQVGGIKANAMDQAGFFEQNLMIGMNILVASKALSITRVLTALSTCAWPDTVERGYPFSEKDIMTGPPASTNLSYGYAKRALYLHTNICRNQSGGYYNYSCFAPSNVYGPHDNFDLETGHFVPALVEKVRTAEEDHLLLWGTGEAMRQQMYVKDLVEIIPKLLELHNTDVPIIVAPDENLRIKEMVSILLKELNKDVLVEYNGQLEGQLRKDGKNARLKGLIGGFSFTPFRIGVRETYLWREKNNG